MPQAVRILRPPSCSSPTDFTDAARHALVQASASIGVGEGCSCDRANLALTKTCKARATCSPGRFFHRSGFASAMRASLTTAPLSSKRRQYQQLMPKPGAWALPRCVAEAAGPPCPCRAPSCRKRHLPLLDLTVFAAANKMHQSSTCIGQPRMR